MGAPAPGRLTWRARHADALACTAGILRRVLPFVAVGIAAGSLIHGYAPEAWLAARAGPGTWWGVPLSRVLRLPLLAAFVGVMTATIVGVGYLFNAIL